ncbi:MAG: diphthine--ammonia ligase [Spirochaetales bacterium]|nr:diphthine--ammonia ligase [Spirochaetales bacterium]
MRAFCSWSGGKDSAFALYEAKKEGIEVAALLTIMAAEPEAGGRSRSHGLSEAVLRRQSECMGLAHEFRSTTWAEYEAVFSAALADLKGTGVECGVFGDIDVEDHRRWAERVCGKAGLEWREPLWGRDRTKLVWDLLAAGFRAIVVSCDKEKLGEKFLGREIAPGLIRELEARGVDAAGENGEYHTFVFDGPLFARPVEYATGDVREHDGYLFLSIK